MSNHKYRRGQRVEVKTVEFDQSTKPATRLEVWRLGSVTNPLNRWGDVCIRMDNQQPYETGYQFHPDNVRPDTTGGKTEFERRHYTLDYLSHDEVAALRHILGNAVPDMQVNFETIEKLLNKMPSLP